MNDNKQLLRHVVLIGWAALFAYFFGQLLWLVLPFAWPINVVLGYLGGVIAGIALAYFAIDKIKLLATRTVLAVVVLVFVGAVSVVLNRLSYQDTFNRMEIQELRDNAARSQ